MIDDAEQLAKQGKPHYIEEQGAKYEGLVVWFNSLVNSAGGGIIGPGNTVIVGPSTKTAAQIMQRLANSPAADPGLNTSEEGPGNDVFDAGTAAFQINYPFVWSGTRGDQPDGLQGDGLCAVPRGHPRQGAEGLDRWLQPRRLEPLQASRSSPTRRSAA